MKKVLSMFLVVLFICIAGISSAEDFTLHSGVVFGMTREEVKAKEKEKGFSPSETQLEYTFYEEDGGYYQMKTNALSIDGSMVGIANSHLYYYFDEDNKLFAAVYSFGTDEEYPVTTYNDIQALLENKYGEQKTQEKYKVASILDVFISNLFLGQVYTFDDIQIELDNGSIISIKHALLSQSIRIYC